MEIFELPTSQVITHKYSMLTKDWYVISNIIGEFMVPYGFIFDWESVPVLRGTCKVGGLGHDYLSRIDSVPRVSKKKAADVYMEIMKYRNNPWVRRNIKYNTVRVFPGYFHKLNVMDDPTGLIRPA